MRTLYLIICMVCVLSVLGCETVNKGAYEGGKVVGKTMDSMGKVTEGGVDGYMGADTQGNPYNR